MYQAERNQQKHCACMWTSFSTYGRGSGREEKGGPALWANLSISKPISEGEFSISAPSFPPAPWPLVRRLSRGIRTTSWWFSWSRQKFSTQLSLKSKTSIHCLSFPKYAHGQELSPGSCADREESSSQHVGPWLSIRRGPSHPALRAGAWPVVHTGPRPTFTTCWA